MANLSLRRYDVQARFSVYVSIAACVTFLGMLFMMMRHFDLSQYIIFLGPKRRMAVTAAGLLTLLLASIGFGMGLNSAGQRRNDKPTLSWIGFFIAALVLCGTLVLFFLLRTRGESPISP